MNVDTAIQHMLFKSTDCELEDIAWCMKDDPEEIIGRYCEAYQWTIAEAVEFLDNAVLAFELLVKDKAA